MVGYRKTLQKCFGLVVLGLIAQAGTLLGQVVFQIDKNESRMLVKGTSNLHEWDMEVQKPEGKLKALLSENEFSGIEELEVIIPSNNVVSGNRIMDGKTRDALETDRYSKLVFRSTSEADLVHSDNGFSGTIRGKLSIAGQTRDAQLEFSGMLREGKELYIKGTYRLLMSDFRIDAPTAMMGTLKTGDEVSVEYEIVWQHSNAYSSL